MRFRSYSRAAGMALPVILIILAVMLLGSIYLLKSVRSTEISTANLSYDSTLSQGADLGLHTAYQWLNGRAATNKTSLTTTIANYDFYSPTAPSVSPDASGFWTHAKTMTGPDGVPIDYVIYRLCRSSGAYNATNNVCVKSAPSTAVAGTNVTTGTSLKPGPVYNTVPQIHYVITSRIRGGRGASVINQMIVLI